MGAASDHYDGRRFALDDPISSPLKCASRPHTHEAIAFDPNATLQCSADTKRTQLWLELCALA
jgi:hypothetical protein